MYYRDFKSGLYPLILRNYWTHHFQYQYWNFTRKNIAATIFHVIANTELIHFNVYATLANPLKIYILLNGLFYTDTDILQVR